MTSNNSAPTNNAAYGYKVFSLSMTLFAIGDGFGNFALLAGWSAPFLNMIRYGLIFLALFSFAAVRSQLHDILSPQYVPTLILRGIFQGLGAVLYFSGMHFMPLSMASSIFFCAPLALLAVSPSILGEQISLRQWFTVLLGFVGMVCIVNPFSLDYSSLLSDKTFLGFFFSFAGMICHMGTQVVTKKVSHKVSTLKTVCWGNLISCLVALIATFSLSLQPEKFEFSLLFITCIMAAFALSAQISFVIPYKYVRASDLAPLNYLQLVVTIIIGIFFFGEKPPLLAFLGMFLIVCAGTLQGLYAKKGVS